MILICFGTRPEWLKVKPLINKINCKLLFTGQHSDLLSGVTCDYKISKEQSSSNRLDSIIANCLLNFPSDPAITAVLIQGDTASAYACALAAFNRKLKVIHLEAGLRTYDLEHPYPEEGYRQMISRITDIHLCPTTLAKNRLIEEKCMGEFHVVGNTVLDNLVEHRNHITYENKILITLHRRENHEILKDWFIAINNLAEAYPNLEFILPIHPNPEVAKHVSLLTNIKVIEPLNHLDLLNLLKSCLLVITDSGGIQEEASFLQKKSIVCRKVTERPEGIETGHLHMCKNFTELSSIFDKLSSDYLISESCPYGDGKTSEMVVKILEDSL